MATTADAPPQKSGCWEELDALYACATPKHQFEAIYRIGEFDDCRKLSAAMWACMRGGEARRRAEAAEAEARRAVAAAADGGRTDEQKQQEQRMAYELTLAEERKETLDARRSAAEQNREVAALTQQLAALQADYVALQRAQQQLGADREALHDRYNPTPQPSP